MKLKEVSKTWDVVVKSKGSKVFSGTKSECIRFIKGFDKASDEYVDLRLHDEDGREFDYHKNEYSQEKE